MESEKLDIIDTQKKLDINNLESKLVKQQWAPFFSTPGAIS